MKLRRLSRRGFGSTGLFLLSKGVQLTTFSGLSRLYHAVIRIINGSFGPLSSASTRSTSSQAVGKHCESGHWWLERRTSANAKLQTGSSAPERATRHLDRGLRAPGPASLRALWPVALGSLVAADGNPCHG